jgi:uroporphyrinogen-III synthase
MLRRRGARVMGGPVIRTIPLAADEGIRLATESLLTRPPDVVVANTGIGVRAWFAAAESWGLGDALHTALAQARILARGPKAAGAIITTGLTVAWRAPSEALADVVDEIITSSAPTARARSRVAFQLDGAVAQPEADRLRGAGFDVVELPVYTWQLPDDARPALRLVEAACARQLDAITFTSAAAVHNLVELAEQHGRADELRDALSDSVVPMCVGPVCAQAAQECGISGVQPERARLGAMIHTLHDVLGHRRRRYRVAGTEVVAQGSIVVVGGVRAHLTDRERAVFARLSERPGAVVSRPELLRGIWDAATDEHALEVTVARLRRRLGTVGHAIETVVRRGYRFDAELVDGVG